MSEPLPNFPACFFFMRPNLKILLDRLLAGLLMGKRMKFARKVLRKVKNVLFGCSSLPSHYSDAEKNSNVHQPESEAGVSIDGPYNSLTDPIQLDNNMHASSSRPRHTLRYIMQLEDEEDAAHFKHHYSLRYLMHLEDLEDVSHLRSQILGSPMQLEDKKDASLYTDPDLPVPRHTLRYLMQLEDDKDAAHFRHHYTLRYLMHLEDVEDASHLRSRQILGSPMKLEDKKDVSLHTVPDLPVPRHTLRYLMQLEDDEDAAHFRHHYTLRYLMHLEDVEDDSHLRSRQILGSPMQLDDKKDASLHAVPGLPVGEFHTVRSVPVEGEEDNMNTLVAVDTDNVLEISPVTRIDEYKVEDEAETCSIIYGQVPIVSELVHVPTFGGEHEGHDPALVLSSPEMEYRVEEGAVAATIVDVVVNNAQLPTFGGGQERHDLALESNPMRVMRILRLMILLLLLAVAGEALFG